MAISRTYLIPGFLHLSGCVSIRLALLALSILIILSAYDKHREGVFILLGLRCIWTQT